MNSSANNRHTVLAVEDELGVRFMISEALRGEGFIVLEPVDADQAVTVLGGLASIDLVFTDVRLPGTLNGIDLVTWLRETRPGLKCAIGSAYTPDWPAPNFAEVFIDKPYDVPRTVNRLKALLASPTEPAD